MVELCSRYSNHPELLNPLVSVMAKIKSGTGDGAPSDLGVVQGMQAGVWRVFDRLTKQDVAALLDAYRTGTPSRVLAARYGIGTTTVKRLLREHEVRRR
ncbi:MAG: resolvase [Gammaproteobacteria bacterium]